MIGTWPAMEVMGDTKAMPGYVLCWIAPVWVPQKAA